CCPRALIVLLPPLPSPTLFPYTTLFRSVLARRQVDAVQVAHGAACALDEVIHLAAIETRPGGFHRRPDPVRIVHDAFQRRERGRKGGEEQQEQGERQALAVHGHRSRLWK